MGISDEIKETEEHKALRVDAFEKLQAAEKAMHAYAASCDVGEERIEAFEIFENIRVAARVR